MNIDHNSLQYIFTTLIAILGWFLRKKDEAQEKAISELKEEASKQYVLLWQKHDQDAKDLSELRLHIASQHYVKTELDSRFDKMEAAFKEGFYDLGHKMDKLTEVMVNKDR